MGYICSDTNVWIDFMVIGKIELPFRLPFKYLMNVDAINDELLSPKNMKEKLLELGLIETELTEEEFFYGLKIAGLYPRLSKYDCAALAIAKYRKITLMTGDNLLRKVAKIESVQVIGTIGILDELLTEKRIDLKEYRKCILSLIKANGKEVRLPIVELENRLK